MSNASEIEAVLFKPSGDYYIYQAPNPWVLGRGKRYVVSKAQKTELMTLLAARRPKLRIVLMTAGILVWAATAGVLAWLLSPHDNPTALDAVTIAALVLFPLYLACVAALHRQLRRIRPILAESPRTEERITRREMRKALVQAMSLHKSLLLAATWAFICATQVAALVLRTWDYPVLFRDVQSYINTFVALLGAVLALYLLAIAIRKIEQRAT